MTICNYPGTYLPIILVVVAGGYVAGRKYVRETLAQAVPRGARGCEFAGRDERDGGA